MLFTKKKMAVCPQTHPAHTNTLSRQHAEILEVTLGTKITYFCDL
jgi:hypothetical protein